MQNDVARALILTDAERELSLIEHGKIISYKTETKKTDCHVCRLPLA